MNNDTPPWGFFIFSKLYKWYQTTQHITYPLNQETIQRINDVDNTACLPSQIPQSIIDNPSQMFDMALNTPLFKKYRIKKYKLDIKCFYYQFQMNKFLFMTKVCFKHMPDYSLFHNTLKLCKVLGKARFTTNKMVFDISYEIFFFINCLTNYPMTYEL